MNSIFKLPATRLEIGESNTASLATATKEYSNSSVLIVTGKSSMMRFGFLDELIETLQSTGLKTVLFEGVEPNPTSETVARGAELAMKNGCDAILALGGGSAIDVAKAIAVGAGHGTHDIWPYIMGKKAITEKTLPIIAVPSTSGTGSHVTWYSVITNSETHEKAAFSSKFIYPRFSLVNTDVLMKMPRDIVAETGFDALAHVMEAYLSKNSSPVTDTLALKAIRLISDNLRGSYERADRGHRYNMAVADSYAGICITSARTILVHAMGNMVSGFYPKISHGRALAALSGPIMRFNIERGDEDCVRRYCDIAEALGEKTANRQAALNSISAVESLRKDICVDSKLSEMGVTEDSIEKMADASFRLGGGAINANPVAPTRNDVIELYKEAM